MIKIFFSVCVFPPFLLKSTVSLSSVTQHFLGTIKLNKTHRDVILFFLPYLNTNPLQKRSFQKDLNIICEKETSHKKILLDLNPIKLVHLSQDCQILTFQKYTSAPLLSVYICTLENQNRVPH